MTRPIHRRLALLLSLLVALPSFGQGRDRQGNGGGNQGGGSRPAPSQPAPSRPAPSQPAPARPAPSQPAPSRPAPSQPAPSRPAPTPSRPSPTPSRPAPSQPTPSQPTPGNTRPSNPTPPSSRPSPSAPTNPSAPTPSPNSRPSAPSRPDATPPRTAPTPGSSSRPTAPAPTQPPVRTGSGSSGSDSSGGFRPAPNPSTSRPRAPVAPAPGSARPAPLPRSADSAPPARDSRGPSSRVERQPSGDTTPRRTAPSARTDERKAEAPSSGSRPIDRDKILERYQRPTEGGGAEADAVRKAREGYRAEQDAKNGERRENADAARAEAERISKAREGYRGEQDAKNSAREKNASDARAEAERVTSARTGYRREQNAREAERRQNVGEARVEAAREEARNERGAGNVKAKRDQYRAGEIKSERDLYRAEAARKIDTRERNVAEARTRALRSAYAANPASGYGNWNRGRSLSSCHGWGLNVGFGLGLSWCNPYGWYWASNCWPNWYWNGWGYTSNYWYWWGVGGYSYSRWCHPFSWSYAWNYGCWPSYNAWWPSVWVTSAWAPPVYYANTVSGGADVVVYDEYGNPEVEVYGGRVNVYQGQTQPAAVGEGVQLGSSGNAYAAPVVDPTVAKVLGGASDSTQAQLEQYLADGDAAFREGRYGDAAHYYAKAIELRPEQGVLYLVLSDALFATGDYHYGAFALRRALEFDPTLATAELDKREFYRDPAEFERQLQLLERFLADRPTDVDARLLLSANYLFSKRPQLAIDLLEAGSSASARAETTGQKLLDAARAALTKKP